MSLCAAAVDLAGYPKKASYFAGTCDYDAGPPGRQSLQRIGCTAPLTLTAGPSLHPILSRCRPVSSGFPGGPPIVSSGHRVRSRISPSRCVPSCDDHGSARGIDVEAGAVGERSPARRLRGVVRPRGRTTSQSASDVTGARAGGRVSGGEGTVGRERVEGRPQGSRSSAAGAASRRAGRMWSASRVSSGVGGTLVRFGD